MSTPQYYCFRADGAKVPLPDISAIDEIKKDALTCYTEKRGVTVNGNAKMTLGILGTNKTLPLPAITVLSVTKSADGSALAFNSCSVTITQSRIRDAGGGRTWQQRSDNSYTEPHKRTNKCCNGLAVVKERIRRPVPRGRSMALI